MFDVVKQYPDTPGPEETKTPVKMVSAYQTINFIAKVKILQIIGVDYSTGQWTASVLDNTVTTVYYDIHCIGLVSARRWHRNAKSRKNCRVVQRAIFEKKTVQSYVQHLHGIGHFRSEC